MSCLEREVGEGEVWWERMREGGILEGGEGEEGEEGEEGKEREGGGGGMDGAGWFYAGW